MLSNNSGGGTTSSDADALISARGNATTTSVSGLGWIVDALGPTKAASILDSLTSQSYQYSADIVAVSPDGRAFKRVKIVVDDRSGTAKIIFRKDLTSLGWPLPADVRSNLRSGKGIDVGPTQQRQHRQQRDRIVRPLKNVRYKKVLGLAIGERSLLLAELTGGTGRPIVDRPRAKCRFRPA